MKSVSLQVFVPFVLATLGNAKPLKPQVVELGFAISKDGSGSVVAANLTGDESMELVVTAPGNIGAYRVSGKQLWHKKHEIFFSGSRSGSILPGLHAPGVQITDVDRDEKPEILFLDRTSTIHILDAGTGHCWKLGYCC